MSLGEFFWTLLVIYAMFFYFMILFRVVGDLFSDKDASGIKKTVWIIALILLPFISLFVYLIVNGSAMNQRALDRAREIDQAQQAYIREAAGSSGGSDAATQIEKAHQLLTSGAISQAEFDSIKSKALSAG
jgi:phospholipase D-like protein